LKREEQQTGLSFDTTNSDYRLWARAKYKYEKLVQLDDPMVRDITPKYWVGFHPYRGVLHVARTKRELGRQLQRDEFVFCHKDEGKKTIKVVSSHAAVATELTQSVNVKVFPQGHNGENVSLVVDTGADTTCIPANYLENKAQFKGNQLNDAFGRNIVLKSYDVEIELDGLTSRVVVW